MFRDAILAVLRFVGNLGLAAVLAGAIVAILGICFGLVVSRVWEVYGLDEEVEGGGWVWVDGQPIYTRTWGREDGPPLVLVHGLDVAGAEIWRANGEDLGRWGLRVIAVDLRGFGHSVRDDRSAYYTVRNQAELLAKLLNQLYVQDATVVGHGWGGLVALQLALDQPQFVGRLALVAPDAYREPTVPWRWAARIPSLNRALAWGMGGGGPLWAAAQRRAFLDVANAPDEYWRRARIVTRIAGTLDSLVAMALAEPDDDLPERLVEVRLPALVLWGQGDALVSEQAVRRLAEALPAAELRVFLEAGHYIQMDQATRFDRAVAQFAGGQ